MSQRCSLSTSADRDRVSARMPPHQPVPMTADFDLLHRKPSTFALSPITVVSRGTGIHFKMLPVKPRQ